MFEHTILTFGKLPASALAAASRARIDMLRDRPSSYEQCIPYQLQIQGRKENPMYRHTLYTPQGEPIYHQIYLDIPEDDMQITMVQTGRNLHLSLAETLDLHHFISEHLGEIQQAVAQKAEG